ncbi:rna 3' terminal phosphate cyclase [Holotrichia oblita]|uniref:Rna 3' terminal phosphate cyclase n=1 Tax=Holotrichia oblita TaxID=644536 RepID=A0ACB9TUY6_HOLOL|nr:rna 3' terminal phosphate cyclase [Holotrichia oblita]
MPAISNKNNTLVYKGSSFMRQRLLLSVLSSKPVRIIDIRTNHDEPGIAEFEVNLIRLLDKVTNGTIIQLDSTGTNLYFQPGLLYGGEVDHECSLQRSIGYYLEVLVALGIFCKIPLKATLRGVSNNLIDPSVDHIKTSIIPVLKRFLIDDEGIDLKVTKRGMLPLGGGEVVFCCPVRKQLRPIQLEDSGMVKRIRGTAYTLRVSPAIANRVVESAKGVLLNFIPDVYINADQCKGKQSGKSPGFGIHLYAETTKGTTYSAEAVSKVIVGGAEPSIPEEVGKLAAQRLCHEIYMGGCVDSAAQALAILCMALGQKDVTKLVMGSLSDYSISFLQHLREFFGITFKLEDYKSEEDCVVGADKILLTCIGIGYTNISKRTI